MKQKPRWEATILLKTMLSDTFLFMFSSKCAPEQGLALFQTCFCSTERVNVTQCTQICVLCTLLGPRLSKLLSYVYTHDLNQMHWNFFSSTHLQYWSVPQFCQCYTLSVFFLYGCICNGCNPLTLHCDPLGFEQPSLHTKPDHINPIVWLTLGAVVQGGVPLYFEGGWLQDILGDIKSWSLPKAIN